MAFNGELPTPGTRISHNGQLATVRYVGEVTGTSGTWLGVEWDNPKRGKHDGVKDGVRYFSCRVQNAGSFIRPSTSISYGRPFLEALSAKYIETAHGTNSQEKVTLGSSNNAIEVEAVNLDKIRSKFARLDRLREVSLDDELVGSPSPQDQIRKTCPNIRGLDISSTLLSSWDDIASIAGALPHLERLALNRNRFPPPQGANRSAAFSQLRELQLNQTMISWNDAMDVISQMPKLEALEIGYNQFETLQLTQPASPPAIVPPALHTINLSGNKFDDWAILCGALQCFTKLQRLVLSNNQIAHIPPPTKDSPIEALRYIALSFNGLARWNDVDSLVSWAPHLETLSLNGNPITTDSNESKYARQFAVAKIPTLKSLDGASISTRERNDSELFYLSYIARSGIAEADRTKEHPRWNALCEKHGTPDEGPKKANEEKLSRLLIDINIHRCEVSPEHTSPDAHSSPTTTVRVLSTMSTKLFRLKVLKSLKVPRTSGAQDASLYLKMHDNSYMQLDKDDRDLAWWGIEQGSTVFIHIPTQ